MKHSGPSCANLNFKKNVVRLDGRKNFEYRCIEFKLNVIPSSIGSFYLEFGSNRFLLALFGPILNVKIEGLTYCHLKTIILESLEKLVDFSLLEKTSFKISSILDKTFLNRFFPNSKFFITIRKVTGDGNFTSLLTWASQVLISLSDLPNKIKIKFNDIIIGKKLIYLDPTSEELFFSKSYIEIISEEKGECKILSLLGSNFESFVNLEKGIGFLGNNFFKFFFSNIKLTNYSMFFL